MSMWPPKSGVGRAVDGWNDYSRSRPPTSYGSAAPGSPRLQHRLESKRERALLAAAHDAEHVLLARPAVLEHQVHVVERVGRHRSPVDRRHFIVGPDAR